MFISPIHYRYISSGWWFGTFCIFQYIGNVIISTDFYVLQRGRSTTNQPWYIHIPQPKRQVNRSGARLTVRQTLLDWSEPQPWQKWHAFMLFYKLYIYICMHDVYLNIYIYIYKIIIRHRYEHMYNIYIYVYTILWLRQIVAPKIEDRFATSKLPFWSEVFTQPFFPAATRSQLWQTSQFRLPPIWMRHVPDRRLTVSHWKIGEG